MQEQFTQETVIAVIKRMGVFQINPLSYRNAKKMKVLKKMTASGLVVKNVASASIHNYFLPKGDWDEI